MGRGWLAPTPLGIKAAKPAKVAERHEEFMASFTSEERAAVLGERQKEFGSALAQGGRHRIQRVIYGGDVLAPNKSKDGFSQVRAKRQVQRDEKPVRKSDPCPSTDSSSHTLQVWATEQEGREPESLGEYKASQAALRAMVAAADKRNAEMGVRVKERFAEESPVQREMVWHSALYGIVPRWRFDEIAVGLRDWTRV